MGTRNTEGTMIPAWMGKISKWHLAVAGVVAAAIYFMDGIAAASDLLKTPDRLEAVEKLAVGQSAQIKIMEDRLVNEKEARREDQDRFYQMIQLMHPAPAPAPVVVEDRGLTPDSN